MKHWLLLALNSVLLPIFLSGCGLLKKSDTDTSTPTDADGNVYKTVKIGDQTWMAENLKTTHYNDGIAIANVTDDITWTTTSAGAYSWLNNNAANKQLYGALYNWYAVSTDKLCPSGWHVPDDNDWNTLINSLGGEDIAGGKMKEAGTAHWPDPNTGATNSSGFTGLPGGYRDMTGYYNNGGTQGFWWSATSLTTSYATMQWLNYQEESLVIYPTDKNDGFSVRCVKN